MEEEEVPLVDGVFEGALGALALEMEALVDSIVVYGGRWRMKKMVKWYRIFNKWTKKCIIKLKLEKFQTSSKNLSQLLASQTNDKTGLGYANQVFTSSMFDCDEMFSSESDVSMPASPVYDRPSAPLIEDWVSDSEDDSEAEPTQNAPSFVQPIEPVKPPRPSVKPVKHHIPANNLRKDFPKSRGHSNSRNTKACFVCNSLTHLIKNCDYYEKKMAQTSARNHARRENHQHYAKMTHPNPQRHVVPTAILTRSKLVPFTAARPVTTAVPHNNVTRQRLAKTIVTKPHSPPRRNINCRPSLKSSNFPQTVTIAKVSQVNVVKGVQENWGNPHHALKDNEVIDSGQDTECIVLSPEFKLPDDNQVLLRVPRENNMYNVDLKNIVLSGDLSCLFTKATLDESNLWHRRLGHINFKTMNKLVKGNLVRGLLSKVFENNHTCVACKKGKQHRASCKTKHVSSISQPLQRLHMDLFGPTFVKSLNKKSYCLVVTDDYSRFT
uniref:Putative ribonuclease H-like domain-containing protein n=1 Tax=Tanacetum cinerariifolium TaxID=118510 RepID=A0A699GUU6_TANCI|nr:putative ribonuclease H-like domain-containing protein [Tanacetum cinerariifolium]